MSTTSFITDPTRADSNSNTTSTIAANTTDEARKSRESNDLFAATSSGRDIVVSRDDKDKE